MNAAAFLQSTPEVARTSLNGEDDQTKEKENLHPNEKDTCRNQRGGRFHQQ